MKRIFGTDIHPASGGFGQYEAGIPEEIEGGGYYGGDVMACLNGQGIIDWNQHTVTHKFDGRIINQYGDVIISDIDEETPMFMYWAEDDEPAKLLWDYSEYKAEKDALEFLLEFHEVPWGFIWEKMDEWTRDDVAKELGESCDHVAFLKRYLELAECDLQLWEDDMEVWKKHNIIWTAQLRRNDAGEYVWEEKDEAEFGDEWGGNLEGYVENAVSNLDDPDEYEIRDCHEFTIHNSPEHGLVVCRDGFPQELLWVGNA